MSRTIRKTKKKSTHTLLRPNVKLYKMLWQFHPHDDDPYPSVPHGHSLEPYNRYKLNVFTGDVIEVNTNILAGKASEKELTNLYNDRGFRRVAISAIAYYLNKNPKENLPLLPFMEHLKRQTYSSRRMVRPCYMPYIVRHSRKYTKYLSIQMTNFE